MLKHLHKLISIASSHHILPWCVWLFLFVYLALCTHTHTHTRQAGATELWAHFSTGWFVQMFSSPSHSVVNTGGHLAGDHWRINENVAKPWKSVSTCVFNKQHKSDRTGPVHGKKKKKAWFQVKKGLVRKCQLYV